jgi:hypothetical protein
MRCHPWIAALLLPFAFVPPTEAEDSAGKLARILADKGILAPSDLELVRAADPETRVQLLASILEGKGVLSRAEVAKLAPLSDGPAPAGLMPAAYKPEAAPQVAGGPKPAAETAPPVTAQSRFPVTIYGTLLTNAFFNTSLTNIEDIPLFAGKKGSDPLGNDKNFGMTARQSRFGMRYQGPKVEGAQISGQFEFDLLGGKAAFGNGINMDLFRLRLALGRLDWKNFSFVAGQDWSIFAPLNPTSLAEYAIPEFSASGNPWIRMPQFRAELRQSLSDSAKFQLQLAAVDPDMGDYSTATFSSSRTPGIGERGRAPGAEARLGLTSHVDDRDFAIGLSSHYARGKNAGMVGTVNVQTGVDSWGVALDYSLPFSKMFNLTGEAYEGRALGMFSVNSGQAILPVGTVGQHGVESRGGWTQAQYNVNPKWQVNLAYGIDIANMSQLRTGDRSKNQTYMGNLMYKFSPHVTFAWEWRRFLTNFRNQQFANEQGDHANMAVAYAF